VGHEIVGNLHMHTPYSDGEAYHVEIAQAAARAGLDFIAVTDHNLWVKGPEGYHDGVLVLVGEEVHNARRWPQVNHLLVYGAEAEMSQCAADPQRLIEAVRERGGLAFIAHPYDYAVKFIHEPGIPWVDWDVDGYHGLEIWNYMSEFKTRLPNKLMALWYANKPHLAIRGPFKATLNAWDQLLASGRRIAGIGNADAHATPMSMGPVRRVIFPYEYLFHCVNTHLMLADGLTGEVDHDKAAIFEALALGRGWVGYDLLGSTRGFRFAARSASEYAEIGHEIRRVGAVNFEVETPLPATIQVVRAGRGPIARVRNKRGMRFTSVEAGAYRVEAYRKGRGWIFSNPIYVL
jgi:hypothetical protein